MWAAGSSSSLYRNQQDFKISLGTSWSICQGILLCDIPWGCQELQRKVQTNRGISDRPKPRILISTDDRRRERLNWTSQFTVQSAMCYCARVAQEVPPSNQILETFLILHCKQWRFITSLWNVFWIKSITDWKCTRQQTMGPNHWLLRPLSAVRVRQSHNIISAQALLQAEELTTAPLHTVKHTLITSNLTWQWDNGYGRMSDGSDPFRHNSYFIGERTHLRVCFV